MMQITWIWHIELAAMEAFALGECFIERLKKLSCRSFKIHRKQGQNPAAQNNKNQEK